MKVTTHPVVNKPLKWPRLVRHQITGTIFLLPSMQAGTQAIDIERGHLHPVDGMLNNLEELPSGYSVTLTNE